MPTAEQWEILGATVRSMRDGSGVKGTLGGSSSRILSLSGILNMHTLTQTSPDIKLRTYTPSCLYHGGDDYVSEQKESAVRLAD